jgi:hypothetical protein
MTSSEHMLHYTINPWLVRGNRGDSFYGYSCALTASMLQPTLSLLETSCLSCSVRQSIHIPDKVYHVDKQTVKVYSLMDGHSHSLASFNTSGKKHQVMRLIHSMKQGIVIVFFQSTDSPGTIFKRLTFIPGNSFSGHSTPLFVKDSQSAYAV